MRESKRWSNIWEGVRYGLVKYTYRRNVENAEKLVKWLRDYKGNQYF